MGWHWEHHWERGKHSPEPRELSWARWNFCSAASTPERFLWGFSRVRFLNERPRVLQAPLSFGECSFKHKSRYRWRFRMFKNWRENRINPKQAHPPSSQRRRVNVEEESSWIQIWKGKFPTNSHCTTWVSSTLTAPWKRWILTLNSHRKAFLSRKAEWHKPSVSKKSQPQIPAAAPPAFPPSLEMQNGVWGWWKAQLWGFILPVSATYWLKGPQKEPLEQNSWEKFPLLAGGAPAHGRWWNQISFKVLPTQTFCDSLLPYSSRGNLRKEEDEDGAAHRRKRSQLWLSRIQAGLTTSCLGLLPVQLGFVTPEQQQEQKPSS